MSCTSPLYALDLGIDKSSGKKIVKLLPRRLDLYSRHILEARYGKDSLLALPCGKCLSCKLERSLIWACRLVIESTDYNDDECYFLTLTYDNNFIFNASKDDYKSFIKGLRNDGFKVRYFGCGEYGEHTNRFHFHLMIFGLKIPDLVSIGKNELGDLLFKSNFINKYWRFGFVTIGSFSFASAAYVARYCTKKVDDNSFIFMSNRPGIGANFLNDKKKVEAALNTGFVYGNFGDKKYFRLPKYFKDRLKALNYDFSKLDEKNKEISNLIAINKLSSSCKSHVEEIFIDDDKNKKEKERRLKRVL